MASKLENYSGIKLYLPILQMCMLITGAYSGNVVVVDRPIQKDVDEYLEKMNVTDESFTNVKKYLDEVEKIKTEFTKKKEFDMNSVLKLLESVDVGLVSDVEKDPNQDPVQESSDEIGARNFFSYNKRKVRSLSSKNVRKPLTEILIRYKGDKLHKDKKDVNDANMKQTFVDTSSGIITTKHTIKDSLEPEATSLAEILSKFNRASEEINNGAKHDTPDLREPFLDTSNGITTTKEPVQDTFKPEPKTLAEVFKKYNPDNKEFNGGVQQADIKEPSLDSHIFDILPSILNPSSVKSVTKEILAISGEQVSEFVKSIRDVTKKFPNTIKRLVKQFPDPVADNVSDKIKNYIQEARLNGPTSSVENRLAFFLYSFNEQNIFQNGIESVYEASDIIDIAFAIKKQIIDDENYWRIAMSKSVRQLLSVFPECLRTLITSKEVCFSNREYGTYLYAPVGPVFYRDNERRYVFGWDGPAHPGKADYLVEYIGGDKFQLKNRFYNEYMYASEIWLDKNKRLVLQWLGGNAINGSVWKLQLGKNYCSLLNEAFNEYLCLDKDKTDDDRRIALTCLNNGITDGKTEFTFINCNYQ